MPARPIRASRVGTGYRRQAAVETLCVLGAGALLWFFGPFGTNDLPSLVRFGYWVGLTTIVYLLIRPLLALGRRLGPQWGLSVQSGELISLLGGALAAAAFLYLLVGASPLAPALAGADFGLLLLQVTTIGLLIYAAMRALLKRAAIATGPLAENQPADAGFPGAAFFRRLPPHFEGDLLCLKMEDHYVRAYSSTGSTLVLMRMRDAAEELAAVDGARVSRSWWVARSAVRRVVRDGRKTCLDLSNGLVVPVSRSHSAALRKQGWLAPAPG